MAAIHDLMKKDLTITLAIGVGAAILVPAAIVALAPVLRPLGRSALKTGIRVYEKGREATAELGEAFDDLVAEVHEELHLERAAKERAQDTDLGSPEPNSGTPHSDQ